MLYPGNYFGDYQILLDHTASETYSTFSKTHVYTHCMRAEFFLDLMQTFPDALAIFFPRVVCLRTVTSNSLGSCSRASRCYSNSIHDFRYQLLEWLLLE